MNGGTGNQRLAAVTGSSRGLGKAIAFALARAGYDLLLISRQSDALNETAAQIHKETGRSVEVYYANLLDTQNTVEAVLGRSISILVNCGIYQGPGESARVDHLDMEELSKLFQGNVLTQVALVKSVLPGMVKLGSGMIFQLVSSSSRMRPIKPVDKGGFQSFGYTSTKAAIAKLVPILALEFSAYSNIKFFNIDPGLVITDKMRAENTAARFEKWGPTSPETTARVIAYLATAADKDEIESLNGADFVDAPKLFARLSKL